MRTRRERSRTRASAQLRRSRSCEPASTKRLVLSPGQQERRQPQHYWPGCRDDLAGPTISRSGATGAGSTVPGGHMRAPGLPQALFALESHIDEVARRVGKDPVDFRLQNLIVDGEETASGQKLNDIRVKETLAAAVESAGYRGPKAANVGRGVAIGDHAPGGGQGHAAVTLRPDGSITLGTPIFDQGSGTYTTLLQVVAEELQVDPETIEIDIWNTDVIPFDSGIGGSRATRVATSAAHEIGRASCRERV